MALHGPILNDNEAMGSGKVFRYLPDLWNTIKKSNIAINSSDARPARFVGGERIDAAISELDFNKRKANFSIKLLEELRNKEAVSKFSSPLSGKNLPFSSLSDKLDDKSKKTEE